MLDAVAQRQRSGKGPCGIVIMRLRESEDGDHRIADEFLQDAAMLYDGLTRNVVVPSQQVPDVLGVECIAERRRSGDVGEQHGDDAALLGHWLTLEKTDAGFTITKVHLDVTARIPGAEQSAFETAANNAKAGCPISRLLKAEITMDAKLEAASGA